MNKVDVSLVGVSGYTGAELLRLLLQHPGVQLSRVYGNDSAGQPIEQVLPSVAGRWTGTVRAYDADDVAEGAKVAFCALPHGASAAIVRDLRARGMVVLDLSADFRLEDLATYEKWYGSHAAPQLIGEAVYGLVELHREAIREANLIAVPGCYPTATLLALAPLLRHRLVEAHGIVVDAKSGVSGAGRKLALSAHYAEVAAGLRAYKVGGAHRHLAEMEEQLTALAGAPVRLTFTPHLTPMTRGILATIYATPLGTKLSAGDCEAAARSMYRESPSVVLLDSGSCPDTLWVQGTNRAYLSYCVDARTGKLIVQSAIDNLVKGAAGQAVQCFNVRFAYEEDEGLRGLAAWP